MDSPAATQAAVSAPNQPPIGFAEFVAMIAALMALGALGIDSMLPALPQIGAELGVASANERQFVIGAFLLGFGVAQLVHGPLADRFGRKPVMAAGLALYVVMNLLAAAAHDFNLLLAARFCAGLGISATRVVTIAMVRDCFAGRPMARVMSLAFMVFMAVPVVAPSLGQLILQIASWRAIFWTIAGAGLLVLLWFVARMPETLRPGRRQPLSPARLAAGWRQTLSERNSLGYTLASTALIGSLYGFINSVQQIVHQLTGSERLLGAVFIAIASIMAVTNLLNSRIVLWLGTRRISHSALSLFILLSAIHLALAISGAETIYSFALLQAVTMGCFGLSSANFGAMAMEKMGDIAGTASSVQGFITVTVGALIGALIGQAFDGTTVPLYRGFFVAGCIAFVIVALTERGRLFRPS